MVHVECSICTSTLDKFGRPKDKKGCKHCKEGTGVEVSQVKMLWAEGYERDMKTFKGPRPMHMYQNELKEINDENKKDRGKGTYTKTKVEVRYKDGTKKTFRVDLGPNDYDPDKEYIGDYMKKKQRLGKLVMDYDSPRDGGPQGPPKGRKWEYYDPPRYTKSDTGLEIYHGYGNGLRKNNKGFYVLEAPGVRKEKELSRKTRWAKNPHNPKNKGKASPKKQPDEVLGSYSTKGHREQKSKPYSAKTGPGSGWHGQIARHRLAVMKGKR